MAEPILAQDEVSGRCLLLGQQRGGGRVPATASPALLLLPPSQEPPEHSSSKSSGILHGYGTKKHRLILKATPLVLFSCLC